MTRQEFLDSIESFSDLINFCNENDIYQAYTQNIYDNEDYDMEICRRISEYSNNDSWEEIRDWLDNLPCGCDYYEFDDDWCEWKGLEDEDLHERVHELAQELDEDGFFDDEVEEQEADAVNEELTPQTENTKPVEEENDLDMDDFMSIIRIAV